MNDPVVISGELVSYKSLKDNTLRITIDLASELEVVRFHENFRTGSLVAVARLKDETGTQE